MASAPKPQKERPPAGLPRLYPRPTAASAARAARIATNRNLDPAKLQKSPLSIRARGAKSSSPVTSRNPEIKAENKRDPQTDPDPNEEAVDETIPNPSEIDTSNSSTTYNTNESYVILQSQDEFILNETGSGNEHQADDLPCETTKKDEELFALEEIAEELQPQRSQYESRPQTPKSRQSSRPTTPLSRPVTPSTPRKQTGSRPNTPKTTRPKTPTEVTDQRPPPLPSRIPGPTNKHLKAKEQQPIAFEEPDIQTEYAVKQRQFHQLKKELDLKQHALLQLFDNLRFLSEHISRDGKGACGETMPIQDLVVLNVGDWTAEEVAQLCHDALTSSDPDDAIKLIKNSSDAIDEECVLSEIDGDILNLPSGFADLCLQAFTARQELIDWVKELIDRLGEGEEQHLDRIAHYNTQGLHLCEALRALKSRADEVTDTVTRISRRAFQERSALVSVGEQLVREIARLRQDLEAHDLIVNDTQRTKADNETIRLLGDTRRALEEERANSQASKEKLSNTENVLRVTRARITKMDRQLREAETTITSLSSTVKSLEDQSRQRESQLEARARKLKESLKTGEVTSSQLVQQRAALQMEIQSLKEQIKELTEKNQSAADQFNEIKNLKTTIDQKEQEMKKERELRIEIENKLQESQETIERLKVEFSEHESPISELPTEREMDLWAELQATKDSLRMAEEEMTACKREKIRFLETLTKISESENKVGIQQKLGAELLNKEEIIYKMQTQIRDLTKNIRLNEQKMLQYEQYVRNLQAHTRAVADCREAPNGISYQDLQQEIMDLRMSLLDTEHRNSELSELLAQKELQLEQQDKTSRAQARVIKVREELINMLKNKETEQSRELNALQIDLQQRMKIVDEVNKQIAAKANEIQELFATLENKQQQIHRLEKIVLALEEQQRRAQAQRTRNEEKIAALEHEIAAGGRKDRKFLFF